MCNPKSFAGTHDKGRVGPSKHFSYRTFTPPTTSSIFNKKSWKSCSVQSKESDTLGA